MNARARGRSTTSRGLPHLGRTSAQKRAYIEDVVGAPGSSSTVPASMAPPVGEGTDSPLAPEEETFPSSPSRPSSRSPSFFELYRKDLVTTGLGILVTLVLGYAVAMAISNNRELGVLQ